MKKHISQKVGKTYYIILEIINTITLCTIILQQKWSNACNENTYCCHKFYWFTVKSVIVLETDYKYILVLRINDLKQKWA